MSRGRLEKSNLTLRFSPACRRYSQELSRDCSERGNFFHAEKMDGVHQHETYGTMRSVYPNVTEIYNMIVLCKRWVCDKIYEPRCAVRYSRLNDDQFQNEILEILRLVQLRAMDDRAEYLEHYRIYRGHSRSFRTRDNRKLPDPRGPLEGEDILESVDIHIFSRSVETSQSAMN